MSDPIEEAFTELHARAEEQAKQRAEQASASVGCAVMVLIGLALFAGGVAVGHWCW